MSPSTEAALKLIVLGRRKPGTTLAEHRRHIRHVHGERVLRYIATDPAHAPRRYVQNAVFDGEFTAEAPGASPFALGRDFVTQISFPDMAALGRSRETAFYRDHLQGDEDNFVDQASVVFVPTVERRLRAAGDAPSGDAACKLFVVLPRVAGVDADAFRAAWSSAAARLDELPGQERCARHVQNDPLAPPDRPAPVHGIDEFWLDDDAAARALLRGWHAALAASFAAHDLGRPAGAIGLFAREAVLYAGA